MSDPTNRELVESNYERYEAEITALKADNERLQSENLALSLLPHTQKLKRLETEIERLTRELEQAH